MSIRLIWNRRVGLGSNWKCAEPEPSRVESRAKRACGIRFDIQDSDQNTRARESKRAKEDLSLSLSFTGKEEEVLKKKGKKKKVKEEKKKETQQRSTWHARHAAVRRRRLPLAGCR